MLDEVYVKIVAGAACVGADPSLFDPDSKVRQSLTVATYCEGCPVRIECRDYAIEHAYQGVWGATTRKRNSLAYLLGYELA